MSFKDNPLLEPIHFTPARSKVLFKGGGGGSVKYNNLENLYAVQAANAKLLYEQTSKNLPPALDRYVASANEITSDPNYAERQADKAKTDAISAGAGQTEAVSRNLASMGVNPNDPRFAGSLRSAALDNAASVAGATNQARDKAKQYQMAVGQDVVGTLTGTNNSSATQLSNAASGMSNLNAQKMQQQQIDSQNTANAVGGAYSLLTMMKDGGEVRKPKKYATGGIAGGVPVAPPPASGPTPQQPQQPSLAKLGTSATSLKGIPGRMAERGTKILDAMASGADAVGADQLSAELAGRAAGQRMGADGAQGAISAYEQAAATAKAQGDTAAALQYQSAANSIGAGAGVEGGAVAGGAETAGGIAGGAEAAGAAAGGEAAAGAAAGEAAAGAAAAGEAAGAAGAAAASEAAAAAAASEAAAGAAAGEAAAGAGLSAMGGALGAASVAMPWVGAAVAVGAALGLFADGGEVGDVKHAGELPEGTRKDAVEDLREEGGKVPGKWAGNKDDVPALLVKEEHVLNAEASALVGHKKLEALNKKGLQLRQQGKKPSQIRAVGLSALR